MKSDRRKFIKDLSAGSAAMVIGIGHKELLPPVAPEGPFMATGIKIGEVSATEAIVWTRLTKGQQRMPDDAPRPVILYKDDLTGKFKPKEKDESRPDREPKVLYPTGTNVHTIAGAAPPAAGQVRVLWKEQSGNSWQAVPWENVTTGNDATCQFTLKGLRPGTRYEVKAESRCNSSARVAATVQGSFKTAPAAHEPQNIKFVVVTCQEYHHRDDGRNGFRVYGSMLKSRPDFFVHTGDVVYYDQEAKDIDLARWHWQRLYSFPALVAFHRQVGSYFMKDDHDTWMNDCYPGMQTRFMGRFTFEQGQQVFLEQVPMAPRPYRTYRWGKSLQIWLVEVRDFRSPNRMPDGPDKTIWGAEQIGWFKRSVQASDAPVKILISPTPVVGPDRPQKVDNHANKVFEHEGEMLRRFIAQQGMYVINGDRHWQYASKDDETGLLEFGCGPVSTEHAGGWNPADHTPEHLYVNVTGGYLEVTVEHVHDQPRVRFTHRGVTGNTLFEYTPQG